MTLGRRGFLFGTTSLVTMAASSAEKILGTPAPLPMTATEALTRQWRLERDTIIEICKARDDLMLFGRAAVRLEPLIGTRTVKAERVDMRYIEEQEVLGWARTTVLSPVGLSPFDQALPDIRALELLQQQVDTRILADFVLPPQMLEPAAMTSTVAEQQSGMTIATLEAAMAALGPMPERWSFLERLMSSVAHVVDPYRDPTPDKGLVPDDVPKKRARSERRQPLSPVQMRHLMRKRR